MLCRKWIILEGALNQALDSLAHVADSIMCSRCNIILGHCSSPIILWCLPKYTWPNCNVSVISLDRSPSPLLALAGILITSLRNPAYSKNFQVHYRCTIDVTSFSGILYWSLKNKLRVGTSYSIMLVSMLVGRALKTFLCIGFSQNYQERVLAIFQIVPTWK